MASIPMRGSYDCVTETSQDVVQARAKAPSSAVPPLSALCATCQSLFSHPEKPPESLDTLDDGVEVVYNEEMRILSAENCHICATHQQAGHKGPLHVVLSLRGDRVDLTIRSVYNGGANRHNLLMNFFPSLSGSTVATLDLRQSLLPRPGQRVLTKINPSLSVSNTKDDVCFEQIQHWVQVCTDEHKLCRAVSGSHECSMLPTRLIDVRSEPRVILTASHKLEHPLTKYATLTHRWVQGDTVKLLRSNLSQLMQRIDPCSLSPVFRDSIYATKRLGLEYIWIDALCIVQDDPDDWRRESSLMGLVYQNAFINLGASAAAEEIHASEFNQDTGNTKVRSSLVGLFSSRGTRRYALPYVNIRRVGHDRNYFGIYNSLGLNPQLFRDPLMSRGWVLQERILSPRSVYFDKILTWECPELVANEVFPEGSPGLESSSHWNLNELFPLRLATLVAERRLGHLTSDNIADRNEIYRTWRGLVEIYKRCKLSYESDIFPALSGLATRFNGFLQDQYLAGLWTGDIVRALAWTSQRRLHKIVSPKAGVPQYLAPSWSWANGATAGFGIQHINDIFSEKEVILAELHDGGVTLVASDPMGSVSDGFIQMSGYLRPNLETEPCVAFDPSIEYNPDDKKTWGVYFEAYDYGYDEKGCRQRTSSFFFALTFATANQPFNRQVRGLILELTGRVQDEYRRIGAFVLDPDARSEFAGLDLENVEENAERQVITII